MHLRRSVVAAAFLLLTGSWAVAAPPAPVPTSTSVRVSDMHCAACAKKIARKLYAVPGVVQVKTDVKKHVAVVTPEKNRQPDPVALWEAIEAAGFVPVELIGPAGKFTSKEDLEKAVSRTARRVR